MSKYEKNPIECDWHKTSVSAGLAPHINFRPLWLHFLDVSKITNNPKFLKMFSINSKFEMATTNEFQVSIDHWQSTCVSTLVT